VYIKIIKDGATMPTKAEVDAKIAELKQAEQDAIDKKASGKQKLLNLGLSEEEVKALIGV
jgi:ubiquitin